MLSQCPSTSCAKGPTKGTIADQGRAQSRCNAEQTAHLVILSADAGLPTARPGRGVADLQALVLDQLRKDAGALAGRPPALLAAVRVGRLHGPQRGCVAC